MSNFVDFVQQVAKQKKEKQISGDNAMKLTPRQKLILIMFGQKLILIMFAIIGLWAIKEGYTTEEPESTVMIISGIVICSWVVFSYLYIKFL